MRTIDSFKQLYSGSTVVRQRFAMIFKRDVYPNFGRQFAASPRFRDSPLEKIVVGLRGGCAPGPDPHTRRSQLNGRIKISLKINVRIKTLIQFVITAI